MGRVLKIIQDLTSDTIRNISKAFNKGARVALDTILFTLVIAVGITTFCLVLFLFAYIAAGLAMHFGIVLEGEVIFCLAGITMISFLLAIIKNFD